MSNFTAIKFVSCVIVSGIVYSDFSKVYFVSVILMAVSWSPLVFILLPALGSEASKSAVSFLRRLDKELTPGLFRKIREQPTISPSFMALIASPR